MSALFGSRVERREDHRLVIGEGHFVDDFGHDAYGVAFVRSPHAHARVLDVDVTGVLDVDGVIGVYTHEDLPERVGAQLPVLIPHPDLFAPRTGYPLVRDVARYLGEPIVMVVARDRYIAEDAVDRIDVTYEALPPVVGLDNAERAEHLVYPDVPGNVAAHMVQEAGHAARAISAAPHRLSLRVEIERSAATPLEGRAVYARWDADGTMHVWSSTQLPVSLRGAIAARLDLPLRDVEVVAPDTGGAFGMKLNHPWPEEVLVPWAARALKHPVKFVDDRYETFVASSSERAQHHDVEVGFDDEGRILGMSVRFLHENGAYTPYGIIVPIITAVQLPGMYKLPDYRVEFTCLYTNTVIVTPYRGAGRPQGVFTMERTIDGIAAFLGKDRMHVREVNLVQPGDMPYDMGGLIFQDGRPAIYDSGDFPATLRKLRELIGWDSFPTMKAEAAKEGRRLGIGTGCYVEGTGVGPYEGAHIQVEPSGRVLVATGLSTQGQGHQTILAQIAADELGVPFESVHVTTGDTRRFAYAVGTFASRSAVMCGNAVALAAKSLKAKALAIAGEALECDPADLEIVDAIVRLREKPHVSIPLQMVATLSNPLRYAYDEQAKAATQFTHVGSFDDPPLRAGVHPGLEATEYFSPVTCAWANGAHAVIVETDPRTAEVRILKYAVVHDCGRNVNPMIVEGQIHGGVAQGVGGAMYERLAYDGEGQLRNASFMDFLMPFASEVPATIDLNHLETPSTVNPLGIKGVGEAGVIPTAAAIAAAIEDAEGIQISRMPISPDDLFTLRKTMEAGA